jgi:hypothetical protein
MAAMTPKRMRLGVDEVRGIYWNLLSDPDNFPNHGTRAWRELRQRCGPDYERALAGGLIIGGDWESMLKVPMLCVAIRNWSSKYGFTRGRDPVPWALELMEADLYLRARLSPRCNPKYRPLRRADDVPLELGTPLPVEIETEDDAFIIRRRLVWTARWQSGDVGHVEELAAAEEPVETAVRVAAGIYETVQRLGVDLVRPLRLAEPHPASGTDYVEPVCVRMRRNSRWQKRV